MRHLAFEVNNISEAVAELDALDIPHEKIRTDEFTRKHFLFFADPDGFLSKYMKNKALILP